MKKQLIILACTALAVTACKAKTVSGEPGAKLLEERCSRCHPMGVKKAHTTPAEWDQSVTRMMAKGATLSMEEKAVLVDYLVKNYKP